MRDKWGLFTENIIQDLKVFLFFCAVLTVFRGVFIALLHGYLGANSDAGNVLQALYYGGRLSMKTAGVAMLLSFLLATLPNTVLRTKWWARWRFVSSAVFLLMLTVLCLARFVYYQEFHSGFNHLIFNALHDDQSALYHTVVEQYQLWPRFFAALLVGAFFAWLLRKWLAVSADALVGRIASQGWLSRIVLCALLLLFAVFVRFGGSLTYAKSLHWENCSLSKDAFLNEAILDDVQALYRGYSIKRRIETGTAEGVHPEKLQSYLRSYRDEALPNVDDYLLRHAAGAKIAKPRQIFLILGESYAQWPLWDEYADLHLADGLREIQSRENVVSIRCFLPNGAFTPMAANAIISGLSDVNVYPNHQAESYRSIYATALAPQMKRLGYKTCFWYAGFSAWERIRDFALAQGFDEFHSASDFPYQSGNVWGADDAYLFDALRAYLAESGDTPTIHVVLTVSNHAPYSVDLRAAGFPAETVKMALANRGVMAETDLLRRLGHYWYTDRQIAAFVKDAERRDPEGSLFVITGDHADRTNIEKQPTLLARYAIPLIIYYRGGIKREIFSSNAAGGHVNLGATLIELIAPRGFAYHSLGDSLFASRVGFNHNLWVTSNAIGAINRDHGDMLQENVDAVQERKKALEELERMRTISWWRTMRGNAVE